MRSRTHVDNTATPASRPRRRCRALTATLLVLVLAGTSGCALNRSFFQMDSNSRLPFMGVDLTPKWPRRSSAVDGVSRLQSEPVEAAPVTTDVPSAQPRSQALPQSDTVATAQAQDVDGGPVEQFR